MDFGFSLECDCITHLLQAQINIESCRYLPALLELFAAHSKLNTWQSLITAKDVRVVTAYGPVTTVFGQQFRHILGPVVPLMRKCVLTSIVKEHGIICGTVLVLLLLFFNPRPLNYVAVFSYIAVMH